MYYILLFNDLIENLIIINFDIIEIHLERENDSFIYKHLRIDFRLSFLYRCRQRIAA